MWECSPALKRQQAGAIYSLQPAVSRSSVSAVPAQRSSPFNSQPPEHAPRNLGGCTTQPRRASSRFSCTPVNLCRCCRLNCLASFFLPSHNLPPLSPILTIVVVHWFFFVSLFQNKQQARRRSSFVFFGFCRFFPCFGPFNIVLRTASESPTSIVSAVLYNATLPEDHRAPCYPSRGFGSESFSHLPFVFLHRRRRDNWEAHRRRPVERKLVGKSLGKDKHTPRIPPQLPHRRLTGPGHFVHHRSF